MDFNLAAPHAPTLVTSSSNTRPSKRPKLALETYVDQAGGHIHWDKNVNTAPVHPHGHRSPPPKPVLNADAEDTSNYEIPPLSLGEESKDFPPEYSSISSRGTTLTDAHDHWNQTPQITELVALHTTPIMPGSYGSVDIEKGYKLPARAERRHPRKRGRNPRRRQFRTRAPTKWDAIGSIVFIALMVLTLWFLATVAGAAAKNEKKNN